MRITGWGQAKNPRFQKRTCNSYTRWQHFKGQYQGSSGCARGREQGTGKKVRYQTLGRSVAEKRSTRIGVRGIAEAKNQTHLLKVQTIKEPGEGKTSQVEVTRGGMILTMSRKKNTAKKRMGPK